MVPEHRRGYLRRMAYYVSHMTPIKRSKVHKGACAHCMDGKGQSGQHKTGSGNTGWSQPFATFAEAAAHQKEMDPRFDEVGVCKHCHPERDHA